MNLNKIIRSLDLSKSDARDKTIQGIIEYILYSVNEGTANEINEYINLELGIELYKTELQEGLDILIDQNFVTKDSANKYLLTNERSLEIKKIELINNSDKDKRFNQFCQNIKKYSSKSLTSEEVKLLWDNLTEYIYECYLEHGKSALNAFSIRKGSSETDIDLSSILNKYLNRINDPKLSKVFKKYIENFADEVSSESLDYLMQLANKSEAFFALGLSKEEYEHLYKDIVFDWTIFVDTNFLYSILDLHSHRDSEATKALIEVGKSLKIKFQYLNITLKELQNQSKDFDSVIPQNLNRVQIQALIKSDKIDDLTMRYFEKKLEDMDNTPHPLDVVGHAIANLKNKGITIHRFPFDQLSSQEDFLKDQESKYMTFLKALDEQRQEKGLSIRGAKDIRQIEHDIFLREAIIYLRDSRVDSISDVKYLGVTLDKKLIKYDHYLIMKKKDGVNVPTFFSPSMLLKKLLKYSPVKSDDYRRAFLKTISTPALDNNSLTSKIAIRSVKYFHNMGISDEKMILNCIKDEMFLTKFKDLESNDELLKEFVESRIQTDYQALNNEFKEIEALIEKKNDLILEVNQQSNQQVIENEKLAEQVGVLKETLKVYNVTINKMKIQTLSDVHKGYQLTIDDEKEKKMEENSFSQLKQENKNLSQRLTQLENNRRFLKWRNKSLFLLFPVCIIMPNLFFVLFWQKAEWNYISKFLDEAENLSDLRQDFIKAIAGVILSVLLVIPCRVIYMRFFSKKAKSTFYSSIGLTPTINEQ